MANDIKQEMYEDLHKFLKSRADKKDNGKYYSNGIHCSSLDSCLRQVVMDYFKFPKKEHTMAKLLMFEIGNFVHRLVGDWAKSSDRFELAGEEEVLTKWLPGDMSGKCDLNIRHKETGEKILVDTKTAMPTAFKVYSQYLVKKAHEIQLNAYNYGLKSKGEEADRIMLTYFDRGGTNTPVYVDVAKMSDEEIEDIFIRYQKAIDNYKENKIMPPKIELTFSKNGNTIYAKKSWQCDYCDYCGVSCSGYPNIDRKKPTKVGRVVDTQFCIDAKFYEIQEEISKQFVEAENTGLGIN